MDTAQWPQEIIVKPTMEGNRKPASSSSSASSSCLERRVIRPHHQSKEQAALNCPRCNSTNTKFCYYNNYSLSQPRYFCKACRRYWTEGGSLRNIPVGGGSRKNIISRTSSSQNPKNQIYSQSSSQNPKKIIISDGNKDLNPGFSADNQEFSKSMSELIQVPSFQNPSYSPSSHQLSALDLISGITSSSSSRGLNSFLPPVPIINSDIMNNAYSHYSGFPRPQELKTLSNFYGMQENSGRLMFPFEDLKRVSSSNANTSNDDVEVENNKDGDSNSTTGGFWNMLGGRSW